MANTIYDEFVVLCQLKSQASMAVIYEIVNLDGKQKAKKIPRVTSGDF
jgi:hypothetical protein